MFTHEVVAAFDEDITAAHELIDHAESLAEPAINRARAYELHDRLDHYVLPNEVAGRIIIQGANYSADPLTYLPIEAFSEFAYARTYPGHGKSFEHSSEDLRVWRALGALHYFKIPRRAMLPGMPQLVPGFVTTNPSPTRSSTFDRAWPLIHETQHYAHSYRAPLDLSAHPAKLRKTLCPNDGLTPRQLLAMREAEAYTATRALLTDTEYGEEIERQIGEVRSKFDVPGGPQLAELKDIERTAIVCHFVEAGILSATTPPDPYGKVVDTLVNLGVIE